jgi:alpha-tubulin suppressor-like RCC1 family protein
MQLGSASTGDCGSFNSCSTKPEPVTDIEAVSMLAAGESHTCAIVSGVVFCWGDNLYGQLGVDPLGGATPAGNSLTPLEVEGLPASTSDLCSGGAHSCAVADGEVWCWGFNDSGQIAQTIGEHEFVPQKVAGLSGTASAVSCGSRHTCAIMDGVAWCWGSNGQGRLGNGETMNSAVPVRVTGLPDAVSAISAGGAHTCAITSDGAWCWGHNSFGQLGNDATVDSPVPVAVVGAW